jgi:glycosyltransferase involved in cell wall biosynthesis
MPKVVILHYAAPPVVGGVEITIDHHARQLVEKGYEVSVLAGRGERFHPEIEFHLIPEIDSRHPDVLSIGSELASGRLTEGFTTLRDHLATVLKPHLLSADSGIVHNAVTLHKNLPLTAGLYQLSSSMPAHLIAWCHDFAWQDDLYTSDLHPGYPWDLLRTAWPNVRYVVVSEDRRRNLAALLGIPASEIRVVHPGVDVGAFLKIEPETRRLVASLELFSAYPLVLLPARVTRRKNIQFAIRVVGILSETYPRATLVVTGPPGPHNPKNVAYLKSLVELAEDLGVHERVRFLYQWGQGKEPLRVTNAMMSDFYQLADLLLFPSRREGFGIPVLEAGLARLPIFAADIPPIRESVGEAGCLFDPDGDPAWVTSRIHETLERDRRCQLRQKVLQDFTWSSVTERDLIPLIEEVTVEYEAK